MEDSHEKPPDKKRVSRFAAKVKPLYVVALILLTVAVFSVFELVKARQELKSFKENPQEGVSKEVAQ